MTAMIAGRHQVSFTLSQLTEAVRCGSRWPLVVPCATDVAVHVLSKYHIAAEFKQHEMPSSADSSYKVTVP